MKDKQLASFMAAVDKIVAGERVSPSAYQDWDEEARELLFLAKVLAESCPPVNEQLSDDDLDMVAGGVNPYELFEKKDKQF